MKYFGSGLGEIHKELSTIIRKPDRLEEAKELFFQLHSKLNQSSMTGTDQNEVDCLFGDLLPHEYRIMVTPNDETIAWVLWHVARIEDLTMGILVGGGDPLFDDGWKKRLNTSISDTGNALSDDEIMKLSAQLNVKELMNYKIAVGKRTGDLVKNLTSEDMKRKVSQQDLKKVEQTKGVTDQAESRWLLDYWGQKDVAGLLLMPPTRHVIMHLNSCCKWKEHIRKNKKCFRSCGGTS